MKLLQKILFVAMVGVFVGNADVRGMHPTASPIAAAVVGANILYFNGLLQIPASLKAKLWPLKASTITTSSHSNFECANKGTRS